MTKISSHTGFQLLNKVWLREGAKEDYWPGRGDNGAYYE
jgi:hypothetical protein